MGYEAYILEGGIQSWVDQILTPNDKPNETYNGQMLAAKVKALREHYLGDGIGSIDVSQSDIEESKPAPIVKKTKKRKKKVAGGC